MHRLRDGTRRDLLQLNDPAMAAAIRLAEQVAAGDVHAVREIVAHAMAMDTETRLNDLSACLRACVCGCAHTDNSVDWGLMF